MFPIRIAAPLALMAACVALAAGAAERRETRPAAGFTAIGLAAPIKVHLTQGDTESLVVEGDEAALAELETVVENGVLKLRTHSRSRSRHDIRGMEKVRAYVTAKSINALAISGSGDITSPALRSTALKVAISGSGDVRIGDLASSNLEVSVSGSGDVMIAGKADMVTASIAGSGDVKTQKLEARQVKVSIAGSGNVTLWAKESLTVKIAGSGDVRYYGDPALQKTLVGSGSVRRAGATPS
jgi:putative autotransporter adhesin-like protein